MHAFFCFFVLICSKKIKFDLETKLQKIAGKLADIFLLLRELDDVFFFHRTPMTMEAKMMGEL